MPKINLKEPELSNATHKKTVMDMSMSHNCRIFVVKSDLSILLCAEMYANIIN